MTQCQWVQSFNPATAVMMVRWPLASSLVICSVSVFLNHVSRLSINSFNTLPHTQFQMFKIIVLSLQLSLIEVLVHKHSFLITIFCLPTSFLQTPSRVKRPSTMNVVVCVDVDCADLWLWWSLIMNSDSSRLQHRHSGDGDDGVITAGCCYWCSSPQPHT